MRDLWRSTVSLLRQYPILWLPVAIVEFIELTLNWLQQMFHHWLIQQLFLRQSEDRSVLSATAVAPNHATMLKLQYITISLGLSTQFLYDILFACAVVATAAMLQRIAESESGTLRDVVAPIKSSLRRILVFALTLFGLGVIAGSLTRFLSPLVQSLNLLNFQSKLEQILSLSVRSQIALEHSNLISNIFGNLWPLPIGLCVAYIIAPLQVRLLQPPDTDPTAQQARSARIVWFLAIVTSKVAICASFILEASLLFELQQSLTIIYMFEVITHLISVAIYAPLFIAIYLIAYPQSPLNIPSTMPDPCPEEDVPPADETT